MSIKSFCESKKGSVGGKIKKGCLVLLFNFINKLSKGILRLSRVDEFKVLRRLWNIGFIGGGVSPRRGSIGWIFDNCWGFKKTVEFWFGGIQIVERRVWRGQTSSSAFFL